MSKNDTNLRIALQRSGRLADGCLELFKQCGIKIRISKNQLLTADDEFGISFIFARDDDIPGLVANQVCDLGIVGQNLLAEYNERPDLNQIETIMPLGFAHCKLSIAGAKNNPIDNVAKLAGSTIATSYPNILNIFLSQNNITARVVIMHGSVELAPQIGIADYICDLVSSGATLAENGLSELFKVMSSEAVLIRQKPQLSAHKEQLLGRLLLRINGIIKAGQNKYIMMHLDKNKISQLAKILPGCESPTILDLQGYPDKAAVHVVAKEGVFWHTIEQLKGIGASSILVMPIEKMVL